MSNDKPIWDARTQDEAEQRRICESLNFALLRRANILRRAEDAGGENTWRLTDWTNALAGETGELCNMAKKVTRSLPNDPTIEDVRQDIAHELADIVTYVDLIADYLDIDLGESITEKFNIVSDRRNSNVRL